MLICILPLMEAEAASAIKFSNNLWCSAPFIYLRVKLIPYNYISFFIHHSTRQTVREEKHFQLFSSSSTSTCILRRKEFSSFSLFNGVIFGVWERKIYQIKIFYFKVHLLLRSYIRGVIRKEKFSEWEQWKCNMNEIFMICPPINRTLNGNIKGKHPSEIKRS